MKRILGQITLIVFLLNILFSMSFNFVYAYDNVFSSVENQSITSGIVQSINTSDLTITLYAENGKTSSDLYRKFNLANINCLEILNNNNTASISDIYPQDKVFLKVIDGYVNEISFSKTSINAFGTVTYKANNIVDVLKDDGTEQCFSINSNSTFYKQSQKISLSDVAIGSKVKLSASKYSNEYIINRVDVQTKFSVNNVYRAVLNSYSSLNSQLVVKDILSFKNGHWDYTPRKGFVGITVDSFTSIYCDDELISLSVINNYSGKEIFVVVETGINGEEKASFIRINSSGNGKSNVYEGRMKNVSTGKLRFEKFPYDFILGNGTLFVKNGMIVTSDELSYDDYIYAVAMGAGNSYDTLVVYANESDEVLDKYEAYYAQIKDVDVGEKIEIQISRVYDLNNGDWRYYSRRRALKISTNTRVIGENGVVNNRNLSSFSQDGDSRVYANIIACDDEAVAISLNSDINHSASNALNARVGAITTENSSIKAFNIYNAKEYSNVIDKWKDIKDQNLKVANNTIYLKNGKVILASDIKLGDTFTAFCNRVYSEKTAFIIIVN